jgi:hypothetical protein
MMKNLNNKSVSPIMTTVAAELVSLLVVRGYLFKLVTDCEGVDEMLIYLPNGRGLHLVPQERFGDNSAFVAERAEGMWDALEVRPIGYDGKWDDVYEDPRDGEEKLCDNSRVLDILEELAGESFCTD